MEIYLPLRVSKNNNLSFNLLAVWNFYYQCKSGRFKGLRKDKALEWEAMEYYKSLFKDPILVAGDWNFGPTFCQRDFVKLVSLFEQSGLKSLYHHFHGLKTEKTSHSTFKTVTNHFHHLDHMFESEAFYKNMKCYEIMNFNNVILSDHAPCFLELKGGN